MFENDIAMCFGENCKLKDKCYRYLSTPDEYQSYFVDIDPKDGKCDYF